MNWTHGYHAETGYTYGYYPETMPLRLHWAALIQGHDTPTRQFRYIDAGCGQGYNLVLAAAAHPDSEFVGLDFMPNHIAHARALAARCGLKNVTFIEADFTQLANDTQAMASLGEFDYAVCHGISTWIAPNVKKALYTLLGAILRPGGVFYNSYNTHPGWLSTVPFQHLVLLEQERHHGVDAIAAARNTMEGLAEHGQLFNILPALKSRLESFKTQDPAYLVQEYNNLCWQPVFVSQMVDDMAAVKLDYLGTATLGEVYVEDLPTALREIIDRQPTLKLKLQVRDYALNQSFRRDLYVKGKTPVWPQELSERLQDTRFVANAPASRPKPEEPYLFVSGAIKVQGNRESYSALLDQLNVSGGMSLREIKVPGQNLSVAAIAKMVSLLLQGGWLLPVVATSDHATEKTLKRVNQGITDAICDGAPYQYISLPKAGCALPLKELEMLIINGHVHKISEKELASFVLKKLNNLGRRLVNAGQAVADSEASAAMIQQKIEATKPLIGWLKTMGAI